MNRRLWCVPPVHELLYELTLWLEVVSEIGVLIIHPANQVHGVSDSPLETPLATGWIQ